MKPGAPQIGFDRFIDVEWLTVALRIRAGHADISDLDEALVAAGLSLAARKKTRTVLNRLWLEPRTELVDFADRGVDLFRAQPKTSVPMLSWGMAIATYPFFGKVAELVGRLSALQGDCTSTEVHRRMSESYGEREGTYRMTNMVLQSQSSWGAIDRADGGKRLVRRSPIRVLDDAQTAWLVEAVLRYSGRALSISTVPSAPVIYAFTTAPALAYAVSKTSMLELLADGSGNQKVVLAEPS